MCDRCGSGNGIFYTIIRSCRSDIVGDFDSVDQTIATYYRDETDVPIREFNPVKDASDTEIAIRLAMTLGCKEMIILGATGGRIDTS